MGRALSSQPLALSEDFSAPRARAQLHALLHLAKGVRTHLHALCQAEENWPRLIEGLAKQYETQIEDVEEGERPPPLQIWDVFFQTQRVQATEEPTHRVLQRVQREIHSQLQGTDPLAYLSEANQAAHTRIRDMLSSRGCGDLVTPEPASIQVEADFEATQHCASASGAAAVIYWAFQPKAHALWGTLAAEGVFLHEYLSHLVPRCREPWVPVREGWLMATLFGEIRDRATDGRGRLEIFLLRKFRSALAQHSGRELSPFGAYEAATRLQSKSEEIFWRMTCELLRVESKEGAAQASRLVEGLVRLKNHELDAVISRGPWPGLGVFSAWVEATSS